MLLEREMPGERHGEGRENRGSPVFCSVKGDEVIESNRRRAAVKCQAATTFAVKVSGERGRNCCMWPNLLLHRITISMLFVLVGASV